MKAKRRTYPIVSLLLAFCLVATMLPMTGASAYAATNYSEVENNDFAGQATPISVATGNKVTGKFDSSSDVDWYTFTLSQGSAVNIKTMSDTSFHVEFYHNDITSDCLFGEDISYYNGNLGYGYENVTYYLSAGTYWLKMYDYYDPQAYSLSFTTTPYETVTEPNDYIGQAVSLSASKTYNGLIAEGGDVDFFKYTVSQPQYCYLTIKNINIGSLYVSPYDSEGNHRDLFPWVVDFGTSAYEHFQEGKSETVLIKLPKGTTYFGLNGTDYFGRRYPGQYTITLVPKPSKITGLKVASRGVYSVKLSWKKNTAATGYQIAVYKGNSYVKSVTVSKNTNTATVSKLTAGKGYKFKVRAYKTVNGKKYYGAYSALLSTPTQPSKSKLSKLTTGKTHYVTATWKKQNATGYQVMYSTNSKFTAGKKTYTIKSGSKTSYKRTKLKKGKTYYVKVRAYVKYGGKTVYGAWSTAKKIKSR